MGFEERLEKLITSNQSLTMALPAARAIRLYGFRP
jgi:hypothetical protein